ncbi:hypothetical protein [Tenacibaculum sp. M341]|uniref:hypothetical protein n=1 Tax=Tenacibaculum sp. M341 TaxID=2530339 RepID=UPI0010533011|nr:hypothetical protein [Tenacibaculum sp. M341]TCI84738.1 hypothetical protein EYW44_20065 [Tenacibaculum sp. M341]
MKKHYYIVAVIVLLIIVFNVFFAEYFLYQKVNKNPTEKNFSTYYESYPNGWFKEDVLFLEITENKQIIPIRTFLNDFPNSDKYDKVLAINESLWNKGIAKYNEAITSKTDLDTKDTKFFNHLLQYMKKKNQHTIMLDFNGDISVKNYDKYSEIVRSTLDTIVYKTDGRTVTNNVEEIEDNYEKNNLRSYEEKFRYSFEYRLNKLFSRNFIDVIHFDESSEKTPLKLSINYNIANEEEVYTEGDVSFPVMWTYNSKEEDQDDDFEVYLIGISIDFSIDMKLPESNETFSFKQQTSVMQGINDVTTIKNCYGRLTRGNFYNFNDAIFKKFGVPEKD